MRFNNSGMALIEPVVILAITAAGLTVSNGTYAARVIYSVSAENIHEREAMTVYDAVEKYFKDTVSDKNMVGIAPYEGIMTYPLGDERNILYDSLKDICPEDAKIVSMSINGKELHVKVLTYSAGGYVIKVRDGLVNETVKIE